MKSCFSGLSFSKSNFFGNSNASHVVVRTCNLDDLRGLTDVLTESFHPPQGLMKWITPLLKLGIYEDLRSRIRSASPHYLCLVAVIVEDQDNTVAEPQEEIIGTVELCLRFLSPWQVGTMKYPYVSNLAVKPSYRRQGVARQLLRRCEEACLDWGLSDLYLHVLDDNNKALQLYFNLGYQVHEVESGYFSWFWKSPSRFFLKKNLR